MKTLRVPSFVVPAALLVVSSAHEAAPATSSLASVAVAATLLGTRLADAGGCDPSGCVAGSLSRVLSDDPVLASSLTPVTTSALLYDTNLAADGGCDPNGCTASNTQDGELGDWSRWSCAPKLGGTCSISYTFEVVLDLSELRVALYRGDTRVRTVEVYVDGVLVTTWTSSGTTSGFESIDLSGMTGSMIEIVGVLDDSEWLSIIETEILALPPPLTPTITPTPPPIVAPVATPTPTVATPEQLFSAKEIGTIGTVTVTADLFDTNLAADGGCDPAGCTAALTRDGDLAETSRWSCSPKLGGECTISYDLGEEYSFQELRLAMYRGTLRQRTVSITVDGTLVRTWESSGTTDDFEVVDLTGNDGGLLGNLASFGVSGQVVQITGQLGQSEWLSIVETEILVYPKNVVTPPPAPTPTPPTPPTPAPSSVVQPVSPTPTGDLQPIGLTALASALGSTTLDRSFVKDGDLSTSWSCTGSEQVADDGTTTYECSIRFSMMYRRHIKQVKIALADGATRSVDMRISANLFDEVLVTSSGTTAGFETYDFDSYTGSITITGVFADPGESLTMSEVDFLEEIVDGEALIETFTGPFDNGGLRNELTTDGFEWTSDSDDAIGSTLFFSLAGFFVVTEIQLMFPAGDTYKFDLSVGGGDDSTLITGLESVDSSEFQSFDLTSYTGEYATFVGVVMQGTGSGAPGFKLLDGRILGTQMGNPTDTFYVASTLILEWPGIGLPDFIGEGSGDQVAINGAICSTKKGSFDGTACVGMDEAATGTVALALGEFFLDGSVFLQSGVFLSGGFNEGDLTEFTLEEGATGMDAMVVMDGVSDVYIDEVAIQGLYDPEATTESPDTLGNGIACFLAVDAQNITFFQSFARFCDGDAMVVRNSNIVTLDGNRYDEEDGQMEIGRSRGTGLVVDNSDSFWMRRYSIYDNAVAGIRIAGSTNFTFASTLDEGSNFREDEENGNVGSLDGPQPIDVVVETSTDVKFIKTQINSVNDPIMTISASSDVSFTECEFETVPAGTCVIQTDDPSTVTLDANEDELSLADTCYVKCVFDPSALYKGGTRTRTDLDILMDGQKIVSWTSSGTTSAFETVELGVTGRTIDLQGALADPEWLSTMEEEILADDGDDSDVAVEASELGAVTATADSYDTRLAAANGCDPQGCTAALTRINPGCKCVRTVFLDGSMFRQSGVFLRGGFHVGDLTEFTLEEGAEGLDAMVVMDGGSDVYVRAQAQRARP
eukprot:g13319.t1